MPLRILVVTLAGKSRRYELADGQSLTVGRTEECDVVIDDRRISRKHAILHGQGALMVEDLGSHNGTLVLSPSASGHGETVTVPLSTRLAPHARTAVDADAVVQIGSALITVEIAGRRRAPTRTDAVILDPAMTRLYELAERVAKSDLSVLVLGESGVGKEILARFIHRHSPRGDRQLLGLNCGAVPEHLLEAELFGYEKGAFTGAAKTTTGLLESASGSTVFLDEVGELAPAFQVKLLRVIEVGQVMRVGGREPIKIDVRYIAATNRDLPAEIAAGRFREDLYYRLNGIALTIPPLRERPDEIVPLSESFLAAESEQALSPAAVARLQAYDWPGNVRQLKNVIRRAIVLATGATIEAEHIQLPERVSMPAMTNTSPPGAVAERPTLPAMNSPEDLREQAEALEKQRILEALEACAGNQTRTAEMLGITRRALVVRLDKYGISRPRKGR